MPLSDRQIINLTFGGTILVLGIAAMMVYILLRNSWKLNQHFRERESLRSDMKRDMQRELIREADRVMEEISREIHDNLGQILGSIRMKLQRLRREENDPDKEAGILEVLEMMGVATGETGQLARILNSDYLKTKALHVELQLLLERMRSHAGIDFDMQVKGTVRKIAPHAKLLVLRIAQEAIQNIQKHSGATEAMLALHYGPTSFIMSIRDNGVGLSQESSRMGLGKRNMQARAELLGGNLFMESTAGAGCTVTVIIPQIDYILYDQPYQAGSS